MPHDRFASRRDRVLRRLKAAGVQALLVTSGVNVRYLTGFTGEDSYLVVGRGVTVLVSDGRFETQIAEECPGLDAQIRSPAQSLADAVADVIGRTGLKKIGFETATTTYAQWEALSKASKPLELVPQAGHVEALRTIKDADEIREIRDAIRQAERGFEQFKVSVSRQMSERDAAHDLEAAMRRFGANHASFETIVAAGPRSALPHARPTPAAIGDAEFVLVDWGATNARGYRSDLTRLLVTGRISPKLERLYGVVLEAQRRGVEAIRPGIPAVAVDSAARKVIEGAGYGKLRHGLGHGIGLEIHEAPRIAQNSNVELKSGMVVTVEPGVYLPGWGGVRIEDDVLVTRTGHEVLSSLSWDLDAIIG